MTWSPLPAWGLGNQESCLGPGTLPLQIESEFSCQEGRGNRKCEVTNRSYMTTLPTGVYESSVHFLVFFNSAVNFSFFPILKTKQKTSTNILYLFSKSYHFFFDLWTSFKSSLHPTFHFLTTYNHILPLFLTICNMILVLYRNCSVLGTQLLITNPTAP